MTFLPFSLSKPWHPASAKPDAPSESSPVPSSAVRSPISSLLTPAPHPSSEPPPSSRPPTLAFPSYSSSVSASSYSSSPAPHSRFPVASTSTAFAPKSPTSVCPSTPLAIPIPVNNSTHGHHSRLLPNEPSPYIHNSVHKPSPLAMSSSGSIKKSSAARPNPIGIDIDTNLARQYSFSRRKSYSRRSSSAGPSADGFSTPYSNAGAGAAATATPSSYISTPSLSSRIPSMPDLTPLPSPIMSSPPVHPSLWLHRLPSARLPGAGAASSGGNRNSFERPRNSLDKPRSSFEKSRHNSHVRGDSNSALSSHIPDDSVRSSPSAVARAVPSSMLSEKFSSIRFTPTAASGASVPPPNTEFTTPASSFSSTASPAINAHSLGAPTTPTNSARPAVAIEDVAMADLDSATRILHPSLPTSSQHLLSDCTTAQLNADGGSGPAVASAAGGRPTEGLCRKRSVTFYSSTEWARKARKPEPRLQRELHLILPQCKLPGLLPNFSSVARNHTKVDVEKSSLNPSHPVSTPPASEKFEAAQASLNEQELNQLQPLPPAALPLVAGPDDKSGDVFLPEEVKPNARHDSAVAAPTAADSSPAPPMTVPGLEGSATVVTNEEGGQDDANQTITITAGPDGLPITYQIIRLLGQGTFSNVVLGSQFPADRHLDPSLRSTVAKTPALVAIKIVALQAAGGASEERIELGLQREVDIIKSLDHPSIVKLHAFEIENRLDSRAIIVLDYCRGGDLFDLASQHADRLTAPLVRRIFAELVDAVRYLHRSWIVHRDIKLENILVNFSHDDLPAEPLTHPGPIIALTDLGLSRRIPEPPADVMLTTRCGSEDYAAPEILLGQRYDGRATDAWACGVVLYALMESRLPFDPPPRGRGSKSRVSHRIARCEWGWFRFAENGVWAEKKEGGRGDTETTNEGAESAPASPVPQTDEPLWRGGRDIVAGLLRKVSQGRMSLDDVAAMEWIRGGGTGDGGTMEDGGSVVLPRKSRENCADGAAAIPSTVTDVAPDVSDGSGFKANGLITSLNQVSDVLGEAGERGFGAGVSAPTEKNHAVAPVRVDSRIDTPQAGGSASSLVCVVGREDGR